MEAPAPANERWSDSNEKEVVNSLKVGMSGLSLLSIQRHERRPTASTMSSSPPIEEVKSSSAQSSPGAHEKKNAPSPISKLPSLTLTPNSNDGTGGTFVGTSSPFHNEGPPIPYLNNPVHRRPGSGSNFGSLSSFELDNDGLLGLHVEPSPRVRNRDLPPLSQPDRTLPFPGPGSRSGDQDQGIDADSSRFGAIGSDAGRRRASSHEYAPHGYEKFGVLPTLASQRLDLDRPRHIRSASQPGPPPPDSRFYYEQQQRQQQQQQRPNLSARSSSFHHQQQQYDVYGKSVASMPNLNQGFTAYYGLDRRDALDFPPQMHSSNVSYVGSAESASFSNTPASLSPSHSPHQMHYSGYQAQSLGLNPRFSSSLPSRLHHDEDLVGEHIEVPDQHEDHLLPPPPYYVQSGTVLRAPAHGHSLSLDGFYDQRPTAGSSLPPPKVVYSVKFKRSQRNFVLGPRISRDLKIGTYVKVEADRGEDLGIVVGKVPSEKFNTFSGRSSFSSSDPAGLKSIIRLATHDEVSLLGMKREEEEELLTVCRGKVRQRGLPMTVVDAEYQFDRHKLTFFFEAEGRVDFRELVRDLFSMYKTRIWMQQLDKNTSTSALAIVSPQTNNMQMDYGTPIIAPVSEFADSIVLSGML